MILRITAKKDGFRRAGIAHSSTPTEYPSERFTPEQVEALRNEPMLLVETLPDPEPPPLGDDGKKGKGA